MLNYKKLSFTGKFYIVFIYRLFIVYLLFTISRLIFYLYNHSHFDISFERLLIIFVGGLKFDTAAILYTNLLFIALSILPFRFRHHPTYQRITKYIFFVTNGIALMTNYIDIPYYDFVLERTTISIFDQFKHETNLPGLFVRFIFEYWYITILYTLSIWLMVWLYNRAKLDEPFPQKRILYYPYHTVLALVTIALTIGGIRGDFKHSTRPITMSNAGEYVSHPNEMAIVLNTPFCLIRSTEGAHFTRQNFFDKETLRQIYNPVHNINPPDTTKFKRLNVVVIIVESLNKEFVGRFYPYLDGGTYKGYSPFLDSLVDVGYTFKYSFANGRKSIDAMPSVLASIPAIESPFVLSSYYNNHMTTLPNLLKPLGYKSAFFHGAPNGSMGFLAFSRLAGFDEYYGKNEYNNDKDFDGTWGIWDEEFLQFMANTLDTFQQPFMASVFTATSHHPFVLPKRYDSVFKSVDFPLQRCIEYTDYAIRRFFYTASRMPWYKNTLFVITADHVSLNQREEFKNPIGYFSVPIIFFQPESNFKGIDTLMVAQQIDILPTVLHYLGYNKPYFSFGQNLLGTPYEKKFAVNYLNGVYRLYHKEYMIEFNGSQVLHLYNFRRDPLLQRDIFGENPDIDREMENLVKAFVQQYKNRMIDNCLTMKKDCE
ncbi:MAG: sulfatase-like hydrolase/transferase, partial [Bacteroidales bacterium]|nr:sulfatase-like hydrolase/transferase [Bacteroidales bacterium]